MLANAAHVVTDPGLNPSPFSPPEGWEGNSEDYVQLMRERFKSVEHGQRMFLAARVARDRQLLFKGPFQKEAMRIINRLNQSNRTPAIDMAPCA